MISILQHGDEVLDKSNVPTSPVPGATRLADGTFVGIVLQHDSDPTVHRYFAQHYNSDGTPLGERVLLLSGADGFYVRQTHVLALPDGGYEFSYAADLIDTDFHDFTGATTGIRHYSATGELIGSASFNYPYSELGYGPSMLRLDSGNVLMTSSWLATQPNPLFFLVIFTPSGPQTGPTIRIGTDEDYITSLAVSALDGGGFVAAWNQIDADKSIAHAQVFDTKGAAVSGVLAVFDDSSSSAQGISFVQRRADGFVIVGASGDTPTIQAYTARGARLSAPVALSGEFGTTADFHLADLSDGGYILVWSGHDASGSGVLARRFDAGGHPLGEEFLVNSHIAGNQTAVDVSATTDGGFIVTWYGEGDAASGTYCTAFSATTHISIDNLIFGTLGNDRLTGGPGGDTMAGGAGDDTYYVDNRVDVVQELAGAGMDTVVASISYGLTTGVENLTLTGTAAVDGAGNALDNRILGNNAANTLLGLEGNDVLNGLGGDDVLSGGSGIDRMYGSAGNDTYLADNIGDRAIETSAGDGVDTVRASVSFRLGAFAENLFLLGAQDLRGLGNDLVNVLGGNSGANALYGYGGNDRLDGGGGADRMIGGTGDDTYIVDNTSDRVYESSGEGNDRVYSSVSFAINSQSIEYVILTGTADTYAYGNAQANRLQGNSGANTVNGGSGNDSLDGGGGSDNLIGGYGADVFTFSLASGSDTIADFNAADNDRVELHAYSAGVVMGGSISVVQSGDDTLIDLGGGNIVTVLHANVGDVTAHIIW